MPNREVDLDRIIQGTLLGEATLTAEVAALLADETGHYIAVNDKAVQLTGYPRLELTNTRMGSLGADERSRAIFQHVSRRQKLQGRKLVRRNNGEVVPCRYWAIPARVTEITYFVLLLWPNRSGTDRYARTLRSRGRLFPAMRARLVDQVRDEHRERGPTGGTHEQHDGDPRGGGQPLAPVTGLVHPPILRTPLDGAVRPEI